MSLFSEFRDKLKVKTEDKKIKKYTYDQINIREDKETGNLELYIEETLSSSKDKGSSWKTSRYRIRDTNVRNSNDKIYYTFVVSPSGHFYTREYDDYRQERRYGRIYSVPSVLQQILGVSREQAYNMQFTKEELIKLIEKINKEKAGAVYQFVDLVQYGDDYKGKKFLEGLHIAIDCRYNPNDRRRFRCIENENIEMKMNENGTLIIMKDGEKEMISGEKLEFISISILENYRLRGYAFLDGYTLEAVRKVVEEYKKGKDNRRENK